MKEGRHHPLTIHRALCEVMAWRESKKTTEDKTTSQAIEELFGAGWTAESKEGDRLWLSYGGAHRYLLSDKTEPLVCQSWQPAALCQRERSTKPIIGVLLFAIRVKASAVLYPLFDRS